jgi:SAM-dependent methyltransferase
MTGLPDDWRKANRANWDERVPVHLNAHSYDLTALRAGNGRLTSIEEQEIGRVDGLSILHLQCHFGRDSLTLAQRGARVTGLDFSGEAITAARKLAAELGLERRARFVQADVYEAPAAVAAPASFDRVFVTWGALNWLPDIGRWAKIVSHFLKPGGVLYLAEIHPTGYVFDDGTSAVGGMLGWCWPYFGREPHIDPAPRSYTQNAPEMQSGPIYEWLHPLAEIVTALCDAGLALTWLHEHDATPWWPTLSCLSRGADGLWRWPERPWLPLSFSLQAERR